MSVAGPPFVPTVLNGGDPADELALLAALVAMAVYFGWAWLRRPRGDDGPEAGRPPPTSDSVEDGSAEEPNPRR